MLFTHVSRVRSKCDDIEQPGDCVWPPFLSRRTGIVRFRRRCYRSSGRTVYAQLDTAVEIRAMSVAGYESCLGLLLVRAQQCSQYFTCQMLPVTVNISSKQTRHSSPSSLLLLFASSELHADAFASAGRCTCSPAAMHPRHFRAWALPAHCFFEKASCVLVSSHRLHTLPPPIAPRQLGARGQ